MKQTLQELTALKWNYENKTCLIVFSGTFNNANIEKD